MFGDTAQHYLGWEFFRHTPLLQWPIGANYPLGMELSSSIVFTDSIPIAAYIAKVFNPILPAIFQYLGIWIWLCFVLQAFFAQRFLRFFLSNKAHVYLGACFVVLSPPLTYRIVHAGYGHIALASHWLILASFCLYLRPGRNDLRWSLLIVLCWLIQAYFAPMVAAIWVASLGRRILSKGKITSIVKSVMIVAFSSFLNMWASGYFMIGSNFNPDGWNYVFRWQPLSLVDSGTDGSTGWSRLLFDRIQLAGEGEAFSYLGIGVIFFMALSFVRVILRCRTRKPVVAITTVTALTFLLVSFVLSIPPSRVVSMGALLIIFAFSSAILLSISRQSNSRRSYIPLIIAVCLLAIYSMTTRVGIAQQTLFEYPLFPPLRQFTETFRTHGRSIWPAFYLLTLASIVVFARLKSAKAVSVVFFSLLIYQLADSYPATISARDRFLEPKQWVSPLQNDSWRDFASRYSQVVVAPSLNNDAKARWIPIAEFAASFKLGTNSGYFSRFDEDVYTSTNKRLYESILQNALDPKTLYIIEDNDLWNRLSSNGKIKTIDGFNIIAP